MYNNNNCCCKLIKSTSINIVTSGSNQILVITIPAITFTENQYFELILTQSIPANADSIPVTIQSGTNTFAVLNRIGNTMRADQLSTRKKYCCVFGVDTPHVLIKNRVKESAGV